MEASESLSNMNNSSSGGGGGGQRSAAMRPDEVTHNQSSSPFRQQQAQPRVSGLSVAALRRSSPHTTPTRTLQLTEQEIQRAAANENSIFSRRVTIESLQQRPRSNQRNRTPRRNESPLDPDEFRRRAESHGTSSSEGVGSEPRRITIRPGVGGTVGTVLMSTSIREKSHEPSVKQGPSHRKVRRWNNDRFEDVAAEIAPSSRTAAQALLKAKERAHLYRSVYDPKEHKSKAMSQFLETSKWNELRDRFFEGELPAPDSHVSRPTQSKTAVRCISGEEMLYRIDSRLRRVITKACNNSYPAARVVKTFETFILDSFGISSERNSTSSLPKDWWQGVLLEQPTITRRKDGKLVTAQFYFDPSNATGGFHRLLLHAVSQFHGLSAASRMARISIGDHSESRALTVSGAPTVESKFHLLDVLSDKNGAECAAIESLGTKLEDSWTVV